jgi:hypothetical protein
MRRRTLVLLTAVVEAASCGVVLVARAVERVGDAFIRLLRDEVTWDAATPPALCVGTPNRLTDDLACNASTDSSD